MSTPEKDNHIPCVLTNNQIDLTNSPIDWAIRLPDQDTVGLSTTTAITASTTFSSDQVTILSVRPFPDRVEVVRRVEAMAWPVGVEIWKDIYTWKDGRVQCETIPGTYHAPQGESYSFP